MNTIRSVGYGWGVLIAAGGGAYFFAKRSINEDRQERAAAEEAKRRRMEQLRASEYAYRHSQQAGSSSQSTLQRKAPSSLDDAGKPSMEASHDPAPTRHDPETEFQQVQEKSKYEASEPFRSKRGDRFS